MILVESVSLNSAGQWYINRTQGQGRCHAAAREHACVVDVLVGTGFDIRLLGEHHDRQNEDRKRGAG